jgi:hypothetical protein
MIEPVITVPELKARIEVYINGMELKHSGG